MQKGSNWKTLSHAGNPVSRARTVPAAPASFSAQQFSGGAEAGQQWEAAMAVLYGMEDLPQSHPGIWLGCVQAVPEPSLRGGRAIKQPLTGVALAPACPSASSTMGL